MKNSLLKCSFQTPPAVTQNSVSPYLGQEWGIFAKGIRNFIIYSTETSTETIACLEERKGNILWITWVWD